MVIRGEKTRPLSSGSVNICTCVRERSLWVCGKWVRVTKSAGVGGGWALSQRPPALRRAGMCGRVEKAALATLHANSLRKQSTHFSKALERWVSKLKQSPAVQAHLPRWLV